MNNRKTIFFVTFICFFGVNGFAQRKEVNKEQCAQIMNSARAKTQKTPRRLVKEDKYFQGNSETPWRIIKWFVEYLPPDKVRTYGESKEPVDNFTQPMLEQIQIGETEYKKEKNGEWTVRPRIILQGNGMALRQPKEEKFYLTENVDLNDRSMILCESFREYNVEKKVDGFPKGIVEIEQTANKYWIGREGLIIKEETETLYEDKRIVRNITVYEFNPKDLKIEAPIIKEK